MNGMMNARALQDDEATDDVISGLVAARKSLPCRLLYDERGAALFEQICGTEDYYPTREELALLQRVLPDLARTIGPDVRVIEPGSGEGIKTRMLLAALERPSGYVPIDVSREQLARTAVSLREAFPAIEIQPACGDYTRSFSIPPPRRRAQRTLVFFPGSTIGNFEPADATCFLRRFGEIAGPGGLLLLGADANQDRPSLLRAYSDADGVTADFNLNILAHLNRTHGATFALDGFEHRAVWSAPHGRIEMQLVSRRAQAVSVRGVPIRLEAGEPIVTEHCYKHSPARLEALLAEAGWRVLRVDADAGRRMHLWLAVRSAISD